MRYITFQKNSTTFGGVMAKKPPRSSLKSNFLLLQKHLKINNLPTTYAILIKLTTIMYLHETFNLAKKLESFLGLICSNFQKYIVSFNICDVLRYTA